MARVTSRGFGVAAGLEQSVAEPLAARCAMLGYSSMWSNDHPAASGLETIASFAAAVPGIDLGVAVLPLDRHEPESIARQVADLGLPAERLWIGVGAGFSEKPLTRMREAVGELRAALPGIRLVLAAMGPKMCELAGSHYDGAFLNWVTPGYAGGARERVHAGAAEADRTPPPVLGYVRTAVGDDAEQRLAKEEGFYRDLHDGYRNHFERLGEPEGTVGVAERGPGAAQAKLSAYEQALDVIVVRGLASANVGAMTAVAGAAAPGGTESRGERG
jgi:alkanesulfonate monooxygenase SsuD/methylene tetrahydromethanopterin reductase-like flavin-dependent oxidoreductase (luciferase family)